MFKKIALLILIFILVGCSSQKPVVRTTKPPQKRLYPVAKTIKKPLEKVYDYPVSTKSEEVVIQNKSGETQILEATTKVKVTTEMVLAYIEKYQQIAKDDMKKFGIPASIIMSQAILESGAGTGPLSIQANNHFGIKCHKDWTGSSIKHDDDAADECFRKYDNPKQSFDDHSLFLLNRPWYAKLFKLQKNDYKSWAKGLKAAGYATDSKYPDKLIGLIERYKLYDLDAQVLGKTIAEIQNQNLDVVSNSASSTTFISQNTYVVIPKDTLYSISKKFNLSIDELKKINHLNENGLSIGQILKIK